MNAEDIPLPPHLLVFDVRQAESILNVEGLRDWEQEHKTALIVCHTIEHIIHYVRTYPIDTAIVLEGKGNPLQKKACRCLKQAGVPVLRLPMDVISVLYFDTKTLHDIDAETALSRRFDVHSGEFAQTCRTIDWSCFLPAFTFSPEVGL